MAIKQLSEEQVRDWTLEQKDRWWFENVWKGDMPQLTVRSAVTGMMLGGILSLTNLYIGAKTGWTLGVGITSVILAFAMFKVLKRLGLGNEFTLLENNCMQSIATAAGYMTAPMISSLAAYMMITGEVIPMTTTMAWIISLGVLGVLFAFPLKRRFINDEQHPFPEGRAAGVVMDALHTGDAREGMFKAKLMLICGALSALVKLLSSQVIMAEIEAAMWIKKGYLTIPEFLDEWIYNHEWIYNRWTPKLAGTELRQLTVRLEPDVVMFAAGGLMGIRTGVSLMVGAVINYCVLAPWMINRGDIQGKMDAAGAITYGFREITMWALWCGVAMMTTASLWAFFSKPKVIFSAFAGLFGGRKAQRSDVLKGIELPMWVFFLGIPLVGAVVVALAHTFFDVEIWLGVIAVPLIFVFTLIAVNSTALTSITPTGALGKLTQLTYGALAPGNITTNIATASITGEVAGHASNLLMDIKPGYMLGGKPRQQAMGHVLGILAGALVSVPIFYMVFLQIGPSDLMAGKYPPVASQKSFGEEATAVAPEDAATEADPGTQPRELITEQYPMPSAVVWKGVAEVLTEGLDKLAYSAQWAALIGALVGILLEILRFVTKGRSWLSGVGVGLAMVIPFHTCLAMFLGSLFFYVAGLTWKDTTARLNKIFVANQEPVCAGLIAGGALTGILVILLENFVI